jgi:branched-chain amino acid transport system substrate-binding protein
VSRRRGRIRAALRDSVFSSVPNGSALSPRGFRGVSVGGVFARVAGKTTGILAGVALALATPGCGSSGTASEAKLAPGKPVEIGYLASLTGFCSTYAREYVEGAELAVERIDAAGGVDGRRLRLIVRNDKATPAVGVAQARYLVLDEHVKYLAGACTSAVGKSVTQLVANPDHVVYALGVTDPTVFAGGPDTYAFDTIPTATTEGRGAAAYVRAHPRWRRIAVISEDYGYGYQVTAAFRRALAGSGQRIVSLQYLPAGGADYTPYVRRLLATHPDAVYSTVVAEDALTLVREGLPLGLFATQGFFGVMDYTTLAHMPVLPVGAEGYTSYPSASIYRTPFAHDLESLGQRVADGGAAGDGFNQIQIIAQGIARAHSTDPARVREALGGATVQTVQGTVEIHACDHETAVPIAAGAVAGPTTAKPFAHLESPRLIGTARFLGC